MLISFNHFSFFFFLIISTLQLATLRAAALLMPPLIDANVEQHGAKEVGPLANLSIRLCTYALTCMRLGYSFRGVQNTHAAECVNGRYILYGVIFHLTLLLHNINPNVC